MNFGVFRRLGINERWRARCPWFLKEPGEPIMTVESTRVPGQLVVDQRVMGVRGTRVMGGMAPPGTTWYTSGSVPGSENA